MLHNEAITPRRLDRESLRVLIVSEDHGYGRYLAGIAQRWGAGDAHVTGLMDAVVTIRQNPLAYPLAILVGGSISSDFLAQVKRFSEAQPVALLLLAGSVDAYSYSAIMNRIADTIVDCDVKTRDRGTLFSYLDDMLALINQKRYYASNPFSIFTR